MQATREELNEAVELMYRTLYWDTNELDLIGTEAAIAKANDNRLVMEKLVTYLGYTPGA